MALKIVIEFGCLRIITLSIFHFLTFHCISQKLIGLTSLEMFPVSRQNFKVSQILSKAQGVLFLPWILKWELKLLWLYIQIKRQVLEGGFFWILEMIFFLILMKKMTPLPRVPKPEGMLNSKKRISNHCGINRCTFWQLFNFLKEKKVSQVYSHDQIFHFLVQSALGKVLFKSS